jgi:predicted MFS family arabinose efflux permease
MAGSGLGAFAFAPLTQKLIEYVGWQYTMVILGGVTLQCVVMGALMTPVSHYHEKQKKHHLYI